MGKKHRNIRIRDAAHAFQTQHPEMCARLVLLKKTLRSESHINPQRIIKNHVKRVLTKFRG